MVFKRSLHPCSLDDSTRRNGRVNPFMPGDLLEDGRNGFLLESGVKFQLD